MVTLLYRTLQSVQRQVIRYRIIHRAWTMAAGSSFAFKTAAKQLQIETLVTNDI